MSLGGVFLRMGLVALVLFGPLVLLLFALDGRKRRLGKSARLLARGALWTGAVVYAGLGFDAYLFVMGALPLAVGLPSLVLDRVPPWMLAGLCINGAVVLVAWWILRDEEGHPDRAMVAEALEEERRREAGSAP